MAARCIHKAPPPHSPLPSPRALVVTHGTREEQQSSPSDATLPSGILTGKSGACCSQHIMQEPLEIFQRIKEGQALPHPRMLANPVLTPGGGRTSAALSARGNTGPGLRHPLLGSRYRRMGSRPPHLRRHQRPRAQEPTCPRAWPVLLRGDLRLSPLPAMARKALHA